MRTFPHLFAKLFASPLMLHAPVRESFESQLLAHMGMPGHVGIVDAAAREPSSRESARIDRVLTTVGNVAVVQIHGVIDKVISEFDMDCYGGCDLADVDKALAIAAADPAIERVVLDIHSPGGSVVGTPETALRVASIRAQKEVHAFTATQCCSAAYYIASQADVIAANPSAIVGSIGVYMAVLDRSRELEMEGIKVELIKAGRLKAMGASFKALTDEERAFLQSNVDALWDEFKTACTVVRPQIAEETMQGQWFDGKKGKALHLVDEVTNMSLDEYVGTLLLA